jgi:Uma2 family endonuclease
MVVSSAHEWAKKMLARLVEALTEELDISIFCLGNTTFRKEALARGIEPDECYYLCEEFPLHDRAEVNMVIDPPPDLVLEVEISRSVLDRMSIYAALGVPEIWCTDGERIRVYQLQMDRYVEVEQSPAFPWLPIAEMADFLQRRGQLSDTKVVKQFREWVRTTVGPRRRTPTS